MKWFLFCYSALTFSLLGCQQFSPSYVDKTQRLPEPEINELKRTVSYGANFALEYNIFPKDTCTKYKKLYEEGNWRAGWVLALHVNATNDQPCLEEKEAIAILTTLESEKRIDPELIWLSQYHLRLLQKLQKQTKRISRLERSINSNERQTSDLKKQNQEQLEKLEALKAIETSINNE